MPTSLSRSRLALIGVLVLVTGSSGCSTFRGSRKLDMAPFAENTSLMFAEAAKVSRPFSATHLRPYVNVPEVAVMRTKAQPIIAGLRSVIFYSNQVVALNSSAKTDKEKNRLLAEYLEQAASDVTTQEERDQLGFTPARFDSVLRNIRTANTFLRGIDAASPLANAVVTMLRERLDDRSRDVPALISAVDREIENDYREKRAAYDGLTALQARYLRASVWLYEGKSGSAAAIDSLLRQDPSLRTFIPSTNEVNGAGLDAAEVELVQRLERISGLIESMSYERSMYIAKHQELAELQSNLDSKIKVARDAVVVWGQSHRNLAAGVAVPPLINLSSLASGAVKAVPLP